jgi:hypothetical protein
MSVYKSVGNKSLACLFPEARGETQTRRSPQDSKASNQPVQDTSLVDALDTLPSVLKVPSLDTWKAVLREGPDQTDETQKGSPHLSAWVSRSSTQERDRGRRSSRGTTRRPSQDHADSTQGNNPRRDEGLRSDLPLTTMERWMRLNLLRVNVLTSLQ